MNVSVRPSALMNADAGWAEMPEAVPDIPVAVVEADERRRHAPSGRHEMRVYQRRALVGRREPTSARLAGRQRAGELSPVAAHCKRRALLAGRPSDINRDGAVTATVGNYGVTVRLIRSSEDDDPAGSAAFERNAVALQTYLAEQNAGELRDPRLPFPPWPAENNPMLRYLLERAIEMSATAPVEVVFAWLSSHAWFEGSIEGRLAERRRSHGSERSSPIEQ